MLVCKHYIVIVKGIIDNKVISLCLGIRLRVVIFAEKCFNKDFVIGLWSAMFAPKPNALFGFDMESQKYKFPCKL